MVIGGRVGRPMSEYVAWVGAGAVRRMDRHEFKRFD